MFIGVFIVATIVLLGSAAALQAFVSPAELHDMGIWIDQR